MLHVLVSSNCNRCGVVVGIVLSNALRQRVERQLEEWEDEERREKAAVTRTTTTASTTTTTTTTLPRPRTTAASHAALRIADTLSQPSNYAEHVEQLEAAVNDAQRADSIAHGTVVSLDVDVLLRERELRGHGEQSDHALSTQWFEPPPDSEQCTISESAPIAARVEVRLHVFQKKASTDARVLARSARQ